MTITLEKYKGTLEDWLNIKPPSKRAYVEEWHEEIKSQYENNINGGGDLFAGILYGLFSDGELVGRLRINNFHSCPQWVEVLNVTVKEELKGNGLGIEMMNLLFKEVKEVHKKEILVLTTSRAKGFYEKLGMTSLGEIQTTKENKLKDESFMYINLNKGK